MDLIQPNNNDKSTLSKANVGAGDLSSHIQLVKQIEVQQKPLTSVSKNKVPLSKASNGKFVKKRRWNTQKSLKITCSFIIIAYL